MKFKNDSQRKAVMANINGSASSRQERPSVLNVLQRNSPHKFSIKNLRLIDTINRHASKPIIIHDNTPSTWLGEKLDKHRNNFIFKHLSHDDGAGKFFEKSKIDPLDFIVYVDVDYLTEHAGNPPSQEFKKDSIRDAIKKGIKIPPPTYDLIDGNTLGEGNHRVAVIKELGFKSIPVYVRLG